MITSIHIKNIGIIDDITINLNEGFNILTGETGAGKTLIIDSLQILSGARFPKEIIRSGEEYSLVEMEMYLPNKNYEDETIIISREINLKGKNTCKINGRFVTVNELKEFMKKIIDIHGQNNNQILLDTNTHIDLLDNYIGKEIKIIKKDYIKLYKQYTKIKEELSKNFGDEKEKQRKLDILNYQKNEIDEANLKENEEDELEEKRSLYMESEKIETCLLEAEERINENLVDNISFAAKSLEKIGEYNINYKNIASRLRDCYYEIQEASKDISDLRNDKYYDEEEQNRIEKRLDLIKTLKRKYGNNIKEIIEYKNEIEEEIERIENLEEYINSLKIELSNTEKELLKLAEQLNKIRTNYKEKLCRQINNELEDLEMANAKFDIKIDFSKENNFNKNGLDKIEFMISTNIGETSKPLIKIASGGEMSRIMLAIKTILTDVDEIPVIIFDEIDTGISGKAANSIADKMKKISKKHQVLCVTHLASVAAKGDYNYFVYKEVRNDKTHTLIKQLSEEETINEIARISSGIISKTSIDHAKELRKVS